MINRNGIERNLGFSKERRMVAALLFAFTAAFSVVLANAPTESQCSRKVDKPHPPQIAILQDEDLSALSMSFSDLFRLKLVFNHEPNAIFFLTVRAGQVARLRIGKRAWAISCRIDGDGRSKVGILDHET